MTCLALVLASYRTLPILLKMNLTLSKISAKFKLDFSRLGLDPPIMSYSAGFWFSPRLKALVLTCCSLFVSSLVLDNMSADFDAIRGSIWHFSLDKTVWEMASNKNAIYMNTIGGRYVQMLPEGTVSRAHCCRTQAVVRI